MSSPPPPECQAEVTPSPGGSGSFHYSLEEHPKAALAIMNQLRLSGQLCDVTLRVRYRRDVPPADFPAHKVVLASSSPVFKAMFTTGLREGGMEVVPIEGVHPRVMERLVEFAYTASISVGEKCVLHVMNGAVMYQIDSVVRACCHFLVQQLHPSNAIGIANFAEQIGCLELHQKAREYIYMHFGEVRGGRRGGGDTPPTTSDVVGSVAEWGGTALRSWEGGLGGCPLPWLRGRGGVGSREGHPPPPPPGDGEGEHPLP